MREAFAHEAILIMAPGTDTQAPGAAVTLALCGHWQHEPPCPLAPHNSYAVRVGGDVRIRTLFAVEPELESSIRHRIDRALSSGQLRGSDGATTRWGLRSSRHSVVAAEEMDCALGLTRS